MVSSSRLPACAQCAVATHSNQVCTSVAALCQTRAQREGGERRRAIAKQQDLLGECLLGVMRCAVMCCAFPQVMHMALHLETTTQTTQQQQQHPHGPSPASPQSQTPQSSICSLALAATALLTLRGKGRGWPSAWVESGRITGLARGMSHRRLVHTMSLQVGCKANKYSLLCGITLHCLQTATESRASSVAFLQDPPRLVCFGCSFSFHPCEPVAGVPQGPAGAAAPPGRH